MLSKIKNFTEAQRKRFQAILSLGTHESIVLSQLLEKGSTTVRDLLPFINYPCGPIRDLQKTFGIPLIWKWEEKEKTIVQNGKTKTKKIKYKRYFLAEVM